VSLPPPSPGASRPSRTISALVSDLARLLSGRRGEARRSEARNAPEAAAISPDYVRLVNTLPDPILVVAGSDVADITGRRFIFANPAAREFLRLDHDQGLLVSAIRDPQVLEAVDAALFGGVPAECIYEIAGAQAKVLRVQARPLAEPSDGARMAVLSFRDETELRRVERSRVDFLANASHELRTPLASLSGFIETLRGHARGDEGARDRFLGIMQAQAERMSRLIDDLMSLSRIELNEHVRPDNDVDLTTAVMDVVDAATPMAEARDVTLEAHLVPKGAACIVGDRDQIVQVVQNLVDNALKYSPAGSAIQLTLEAGLTAAQAAAGRRTDVARLSLLTPDHPAETYAVLRVSDEGAGMARQHLPRLTERFYRIEGQKSGDKEGTGLGLAIVKHIANRHRGGLVVESAEGRGSTFTAYFPIRGGAAKAAVAKLS
jgi:two-component system phosphate regulon sensor histidine kinase PhoR